MVRCVSARPVCLGLEDKHVAVFKKKAERGFVCWAESEKKSESRQVERFDVDQAKAKEALKQLDQQLQSISQKQLRSPKINASDVKLTNPVTREQATVKEELPEFSASFLAYTAGALILFTIFYNALFYGVIRPAIDIPIEPDTVAVESQIRITE